jgi:Cdc6-like AAA superfamily ATPase
MSQINSILAMKVRLLQTWGLREHPPFRGVPSGDITELMKVFVDRDKERQRAILTLDEGENILVRGMTGIGKTAFIMAVLHEIEQQAKMLHQDILPIHIRQFAGGTRDDFYRVILYALAKQLGPTNKHAREIVYALTGEEITRGRSGGLSAGIEIGVSPLFKATTQGEVGKEQSKVLKIVQPEHFLGKLLDEAMKKYRRVIFAVDDLERVPNQGSIKLMLESSLDLIRDKRCAFILTGRTLTILEDVYASGLDIFNEVIPLQPLSSSELRLIAIRTLNLVRYQQNEISAFPFSDDAIETIASRSFGIPRSFILECGKILKIAIELGAEELTRDVFEQIFELLQDEIARKDVPPDIRRIIYLGLQQGGFSVSKDADLDQVFSILGIATRRQFVDFADNLVQQDLLQRITDERGEILYRLAPGVEKLAQSGALLVDGSTNSSVTT